MPELQKMLIIARLYGDSRSKQYLEMMQFLYVIEKRVEARRARRPQLYARLKEREIKTREESKIALEKLKRLEHCTPREEYLESMQVLQELAAKDPQRWDILLSRDDLETTQTLQNIQDLKKRIVELWKRGHVSQRSQVSRFNSLRMNESKDLKMTKGETSTSVNIRSSKQQEKAKSKPFLFGVGLLLLGSLVIILIRNILDFLYFR